MGLFYNNNEAGSGVSKNKGQKRPFFRFCEMFANKFWTFFKINLIYFAFCIPIVTFGPATAAMTALMRNIYLERPQFIFHDFLKEFKKNFKQSFMVGMVDVAFISLAVFGYMFYSVSIDETDYYWLFYALMMAAAVIFMLINFYIYPQIVALDLKMGSIIKNSVILAFVNLKGNLVALAAYIVYILLLMFFNIYVLTLAPLVPFAWLGFISVFCCYPAIQKYIINPFYEAKGEKNPELAINEGEGVIFEDKGGSEAPIKLKDKDKRGKIIR